MKIEKWYEKAIAIFDEESKNGAIAANLDDGFIFANAAGTYALFIPGYSAASAVWEREEMARKSNTCAFCTIRQQRLESLPQVK